MLIVGIVIAILGGGLLFAGSRQKKTGSAMQQSQVIPISQAVAGSQVEIEGTIVCNAPLQTPYSKQNCVAYEYTLEREERTVDARNVPTTRWQQISSDKQAVPFMVQDVSGSIAVNPDRASLDLQNFGEQLVSMSDATSNPLFQTVLHVMGNGNSRVREKALMVGSHAYVFGSVENSEAGLQVAKGQSDFVISYKTEAQVEKAKARSAMTMTVIGVIAIIGGIALVVFGFVK